MSARRRFLAPVAAEYDWGYTGRYQSSELGYEVVDEALLGLVISKTMVTKIRLEGVFKESIPGPEVTQRVMHKSREPKVI